MKTSNRSIEKPLKKILRSGRRPEIKRKKFKENQRLIISRLGLKMKLSDVEYQGDGNKATFYYTADDRVDFQSINHESLPERLAFELK